MLAYSSIRQIRYGDTLDPKSRGKELGGSFTPLVVALPSPYEDDDDDPSEDSLSSSSSTDDDER